MSSPNIESSSFAETSSVGGGGGGGWGLGRITSVIESRAAWGTLFLPILCLCITGIILWKACEAGITCTGEPNVANTHPGKPATNFDKVLWAHKFGWMKWWGIAMIIFGFIMLVIAALYAWQKS